MANRLEQEKSPYLLQHRDNPVNWYPWCREAFQKAAEEEKPVFLSIGYSTCHWCHVMAHESFEDQEVAGLLNRAFISIKVDREERPDVDAVYMSVCQAMTGSGGWPLTIIMTPEQKPFFAGTYFPKHSGYGRYGLMELLEQVADLWKHRRQALLHMGNQIAAAISQTEVSSGGKPLPELIEKAYHQLTARFDHKWGGFSSAPKFPTPHDLLFLMRYAEMQQEPQALRMADLSLEAMARGGIHDQIGGGFSRYSTDEKWLVPHFEKMLYDNALLLMAYLRGYQYTKKGCFGDVSHRTAQYILRELIGPKGGCFCGQDADSDGVEGKFYVFTPEEVISVLGAADGAEFCRLYGITDEGNFEGKSIPNRIGSRGIGWDRKDSRLQRLYDYRRTRTKLHKDDKILLSWNAWAMIGLARAGQILGDQTYLDAAMEIHGFIHDNMNNEQGRLLLRYRDGEAAHEGQLEDYAVYALALLELYSVTFRAEYLELAIYRTEQMAAFFEDQKNGGYFMTASHGEQLIARPKETYDGAMPSGNSVAAVVLQRLSALTGSEAWRQAARRQLDFLARAASGYPASSCFGMLALMDAGHPHRELICTSADGIPSALQAFLKKKPAENLQVVVKTAENGPLLARLAPFTADYPIPQTGAMYYLCENGACKAPTAELEQLGL